MVLACIGSGNPFLVLAVLGLVGFGTILLGLWALAEAFIDGRF
jgi:hypothetical protein